MPKPEPNEDKKHYISRCIKVLMNEGKPQKQAIAICYSMWERKDEDSIINKINVLLNDSIVTGDLLAEPMLPTKNRKNLNNFGKIRKNRHKKKPDTEDN
jgi:hypothetical protein